MLVSYTQYMQLQKEVKSNPKQPNCKKSVRPPRRQKRCESNVATKKWLDGRLMKKILIMATQVNLVPNPSETTNSPELSLLKFLPLAYHLAISWPPPWISHLFYLLGVHTLFLQLGCFGLLAKIFLSFISSCVPCKKFIWVAPGMCSCWEIKKPKIHKTICIWKVVNISPLNCW